MFVSEITRIDWINGKDLSRLMILQRTENEYLCLVRELRGLEKEGGCDACQRRHSFTNPRCQMNLAEKRTYFNCFYDFNTRMPIPGIFVLVDVISQKGSVSQETWKKIAPRAPTQTGGQLIYSI